jgi:7,8-dihydroneopterin aldolase/epimerase/oxygenase
MKTTWNEELALTCRRLFLRDYEIFINIGIHDFEKKGEQRVLVNVDLYISLAESTPQHDRLEEVVDYDFIRRSIFDRVSRGHIHLQETLCDELLQAMLAHPKVWAARVSTEKPDVYPDCAAVGVEVFRLKPAAERGSSPVVSPPA